MKKNTKRLIAILSVITLTLGTFSIGATQIFANSEGSSTEESIITNEELGLEEANQQYDAQREEEIENDLLALTILRKYQKTDMTELTDDKKTDCDLMFVICDMIDNNEFNDDELPVMKKYLETRYYMLNIPNDISPILDYEPELEQRIVKIMGWTDYME